MELNGEEYKELREDVRRLSDKIDSIAATVNKATGAKEEARWLFGAAITLSGIAIAIAMGGG